MKKLVFIFWIICLSVRSIASEPQNSWIASQDGKYLCSKISINARRAHIVLENGEKMAFPVDVIDSFSLNGREFDKLPLYKNGKITDHQVFMELICRSKQCRLYRYGHCKINCSQIREGVYNYYIYKGEYLQMASNCLGLPQACLYNTIKQRYK
jgi:hypothetical protein